MIIIDFFYFILSSRTLSMLLKTARPPSTSVIMVAEMNRITVFPACLAHCSKGVRPTSNASSASSAHSAHVHRCTGAHSLTPIIVSNLCKAARAGNPQQTGSAQAWRNDN